MNSGRCLKHSLETRFVKKILPCRYKAVIGVIAFALASCSVAVPDRSLNGVGFGNYATYQGEYPTPVRVQTAQAPVVASTGTYQVANVAAGGGLPVGRYKGRRNLSKLGLRSAAELTKGVTSGWGQSGSYATVLIAGQKMKAQQVYVGVHHFVVLKAVTANHFLFGIGANKSALRGVMAEVASVLPTRVCFRITARILCQSAADGEGTDRFFSRKL